MSHSAVGAVEMDIGIVDVENSVFAHSGGLHFDGYTTLVDDEGTIYNGDVGEVSVETGDTVIILGIDDQLVVVAVALDDEMVFVGSAGTKHNTNVAMEDFVDAVDSDGECTTVALDTGTLERHDISAVEGEGLALVVVGDGLILEYVEAVFLVHLGAVDDDSLSEYDGPGDVIVIADEFTAVRAVEDVCADIGILGESERLGVGLEGGVVD